MLRQQLKPIRLKRGDILLIIDLQNDFLPGGALAVSQGDRVIPVMNRYISLFQKHHLPVVATRDWHPADHCSFKTQGGPWPEHCIAGTEGSAFAADLQLPETAVVVSKGTDQGAPGYSGFEGTALQSYLAQLNARRLFIGGLATDYCVLATALDAVAHHYQIFLLDDASRAVDIDPQNGHNAIHKMMQQGVIPITLADLQ